MSPSDVSCKTCKYWEQITNNPGENFGYCRVYPPFLTTDPKIRHLNEEVSPPTVQDNSWCGEYVKV